jgi:hypothetical protein
MLELYKTHREYELQYSGIRCLRKKCNCQQKRLVRTIPLDPLLRYAVALNRQRSTLRDRQLNKDRVY